MTFQEFINSVDLKLQAEIGLSLWDLPDYDYHTEYSLETPIEDMINIIKEENGLNNTHESEGYYRDTDTGEWHYLVENGRIYLVTKEDYWEIEELPNTAEKLPE